MEIRRTLDKVIRFLSILRAIMFLVFLLVLGIVYLLYY